MADTTPTPAADAVSAPRLSLVKDTPAPAPPVEPVRIDPSVRRRRALRARRAAGAVRAAVTDERTVAAGRLAARHGMYVVGGTRIVVKRAWDGRTTARYERMMRAAEAAGNPDQALEWEARAAAFRSARHQRRMDLLKAPQKAAKGLGIAAVGTQGALLALGIMMAVSSGQWSDILAPTLWVIEAVNLLIVIVAVVWGPLVAIAPWAALLALWGVGKRRQAAPQWALPSRATPGASPSPPRSWSPPSVTWASPPCAPPSRTWATPAREMLGPIRIAGCGVEVDITLPSGCSTEEVMNRRRKMAENLGRHEHELHMSVAPAARTVRAWIADSGALDEPVCASPLVTDPDARADYKSGRAPWGLDLRGDAALVSLYQRHLLITGLSNQGKTASLRALALWLALDRTVEFRIADLKGVGDWHMFDGLATC